ncbi:coiled-coil domain-containing protein 91-like [Xenia sp. Carnegie-2017]|uniref:coiled-coil domain-containing protein 91-like n=1 Tax=Xenia sp. Carnegie-2017 TaxID=2897299 RepID=UPI001F03AB10|nr:coiled-coil domain-containing protein 91-like [Xenia sp. Carnegie-2017]
MVVEEQTKGLHKIEDALEEQKAKYEKKLNDCLEEERKKNQELLEKALEEERARGVAAADELLLNQKKEFESMISSVKKQFEENLCQERKETKNLISKFVEDQKEEAKSNLNETMVEERENHVMQLLLLKTN